MELSRRDVLKLGLLGSAALYLPVERLARAEGNGSLTTLPTPFTRAFVVPPSIDLRQGGSTQITMRSQRFQVLGPAPTWPSTELWTYVGPQGQVNPTIHVQRNRPVEITQVNRLPDRHPQLGYEAWTSVHLHGSPSLPQYDGYANDVTKPNQKKLYKYDNPETARTLWYHDHAVHRTDANAYMGLAAQYHLHDDVEPTLGLPSGAYEAPLTLRDVAFQGNGDLLFDDRSESSLMGDVILANGVPWPAMKVEQRRYRFRLLNAGVSRSYLLSLSDPRAEMWVIATDGGFVPFPARISSLRVGMAERYELIIDFTKCPLNTQVVMRNGDLPNNVRFANTDKVMRFDVVSPPTTPVVDKIPTTLPTNEAMRLTEDQAVRRRTMEFVRKNGHWTINGRVWDEVVGSNYRSVLADPNLGDIEVWEFVNNSGGWFHPVHVHLVDFKILSRNGRPAAPYEQGPKDVVYVGEGERVKLVMRFGPHEGRYMMHCHNLVHEDHDMMHQFRVGPDRNPDPNDPITAAPPVPA
jgi:spore coat protein A, manganese oxidase